MNERSNDEPALYPIRTVASITGVNPVTLRAWERRYGLIRPRRTAKGHRLYTQDDIDQIQRVLELLEGGIPISQARRRLEQGGGEGEAPEEPWGVYQRRMLSAVGRFDEASLDAIYNDALALYPVELVTERIILPLLRALGERWREQPAGVAQEHFFGSFLRNKIGARFHHRASGARGPKLVAACIPGEHHEVGLLLFCLAAAEHGYRPVLLGADMPLAELPPAVERAGAAAVVLSGTYDPPPGVLEHELPELVAQAGVPVFVGGRTAARHHDPIVRSGAVPLGMDIGAALRRMSEALGDGDAR